MQWFLYCCLFVDYYLSISVRPCRLLWPLRVYYIIMGERGVPAGKLEKKTFHDKNLRAGISNHFYESVKSFGTLLLFGTFLFLFEICNEILFIHNLSACDTLYIYPVPSPSVGSTGSKKTATLTQLKMSKKC